MGIAHYLSVTAVLHVGAALHALRRHAASLHAVPRHALAGHVLALHALAGEPHLAGYHL